MYELKIQITDNNSAKLACRWILVCAILHNFLISEKDPNFSITSDIVEENETNDPEYQNVPRIEGASKRLALLSLIKALNS